jgi:hypothetical protein
VCMDETREWAQASSRAFQPRALNELARSWRATPPPSSRISCVSPPSLAPTHFSSHYPPTFQPPIYHRWSPLSPPSPHRAASAVSPPPHILVHPSNALGFFLRRYATPFYSDKSGRPGTQVRRWHTMRKSADEERSLEDSELALLVEKNVNWERVWRSRVVRIRICLTLSSVSRGNSDRRTCTRS